MSCEKGQLLPRVHSPRAKKWQGRGGDIFGFLERKRRRRAISRSRYSQANRPLAILFWESVIYCLQARERARESLRCIERANGEKVLVFCFFSSTDWNVVANTFFFGRDHLLVLVLLPAALSPRRRACIAYVSLEWLRKYLSAGSSQRRRPCCWFGSRFAPSPMLMLELMPSKSPLRPRPLPPPRRRPSLPDATTTTTAAAAPSWAREPSPASDATGPPPTRTTPKPPLLLLLLLLLRPSPLRTRRTSSRAAASSGATRRSTTSPAGGRGGARTSTLTTARKSTR